MLTQAQAREVNRAKRLETFFSENASVIAGYVPFADEVGVFSDNLEELDIYIQDKNGTGKGITSSKTILKRSVADRLGIICATTKAYAVKFNNGELAAEIDLRSAEIFRLKDADLLPFALHAQELITPLLTNANYIPYGVTAEALSAIVDYAQTFNNLIGQADVETSGSTVASKNIDAVIKKLQGNIAQFDLLIDYFADKDADFVTGYRINSAVDNTGIRHSGVEGFVMYNGAPVAGAIVKLANSKKKVVTDLNGFYSIVKVTPGNYSVEVQANGHGSKAVVQRIMRGKVTKLDFELLAAA